MSIACRCDRCGNFFLPKDNGCVKEIKTSQATITERLNGPVDIKSYHLCDNCDVNFEKWIRGFENVKGELKDG